MLEEATRVLLDVIATDICNLILRICFHLLLSELYLCRW